jgi:hypothetical protein
MGSQLDLFGALVVHEPPRGRSAGSKPRTSGPKADDPGRSTALPALAPCPHHGPEFICPSCADCGDTDGCGFLHRQVCGGRIPLRACRQCGQLRTHGRWSHATWWFCLDCRPLGARQ